MNATTTTNARVLYRGKTHTTSGPEGASKSSDGFVDIKLAQPHPAAENLFATAWSACYLAALELSAAQRKINLPEHPSVDTEIDLSRDGTGFFLRARLSVSLPGIDRAVAEGLTLAAHEVCPYSKAVHGNIEVTTTVV
jgi:osmotically inducible protein OsmC